MPQGRPFHVGCGERTTRVIGPLTISRHVPGLWTSPAEWTLPDQLYFVCPVHGAVRWEATRFDERAARGASKDAGRRGAVA